MVDITPAYDVPQTLSYNVNSYTLNANVEFDIAETDPVYKVTGDEAPEGKIISLKGSTTEFSVGDVFALGEELTETQFKINEIIKTEVNGTLYTNFVYAGVTSLGEAQGTLGKQIYKIGRTQSATAEIPFSDLVANYDASSYETKEHTVSNPNTFDEDKKSLAFVNSTAKLKFFARTPGTDGNNTQIAIAKPEDFGANKEIADGISLDNQFDTEPYGSQFAIIVLHEGEIVETFIVSFDETEKNDNNEFIFVENQINDYSSYVLVSVNEALADSIKTCLGDDIITLSGGSFSDAGTDDIETAYNTLSNKEELDIDLIIGNELYPQAATALAINRADCIAFIGVPRSTTVGLKTANAITKAVEYRKSLNIDSKYCTLSSNYKYQYSSDLGKNIWVNLAGDIAGLKAQSNFNNYTWYAAAGLNRGNIKNVVKLSDSPNNTHRDFILNKYEKELKYGLLCLEINNDKTSLIAGTLN